MKSRKHWPENWLLFNLLNLLGWPSIFGHVTSLAANETCDCLSFSTFLSTIPFWLAFTVFSSFCKPLTLGNPRTLAIFAFAFLSFTFCIFALLASMGVAPSSMEVFKGIWSADSDDHWVVTCSWCPHMLCCLRSPSEDLFSRLGEVSEDCSYFQIFAVCCLTDPLIFTNHGFELSKLLCCCCCQTSPCSKPA